LQIIENDFFKEKAGNNSLRKNILFPPRGIIYDRNNIPIVDNKPLYQIKIIPKDIQENFDYEVLKKHTGISKSFVDSVIDRSKRIPGGQFKEMLLQNYVDIRTKSILEEYKLDMKGMNFTPMPARVYPSDCKLSHVLGYLKKVDKKDTIYDINDIVGYNGVEKYYENSLHGDYGIDFFLVDALGVKNRKYDTEHDKNPIQGDDLVLTIDSDIQHFSEDIFSGLKGSIILMDPSNGEIISMVSNPVYDLDTFVGSLSQNDWNELNNDPDSPLLNRVIQSNYPPGSIFKLVTSAIAIEKNIIDGNWTVDCNGEYDFYNTTFRCWKESGHGKVNLNEAIKGSCNIFFYNLMQKIEFSDWSSISKEFGFGQRTGIDLLSENSGLVPDKSYMNKFYKDKGGWSKGHLLNLSIGQGEVSVTPIQIIQLINSIANNGILYSPHLNIAYEPINIKLNYKDIVWSYLRKAMHDAVNSNGGTAYNARIDKNFGLVYGKTGTAQVCSNCEVEPHGWFAGFMELNNGKKYSICIMIENGGKGSEKPTQIAKKIFQYIIGKNNV
jgi:penicillin-binding protein 2